MAVLSLLILACEDGVTRPNHSGDVDSARDSAEDTGERPLSAPLGAIAVSESASDLVPLWFSGGGAAAATVLGFVVTPADELSLCFPYPLDLETGQEVLGGLGGVGAAVPTAAGPSVSVLLSGADFGVNAARSDDPTACSFDEGFQLSSPLPFRPSRFFGGDTTGDAQADYLYEAYETPDYPYSEIWVGSAFIYPGPVQRPEQSQHPLGIVSTTGQTWSPDLEMDEPAAALQDVTGDGLADYVGGGFRWDRRGDFAPVVLVYPAPFEHQGLDLPDTLTAIETGASGAEPREIVAFGDFNGDGLNDVVLGGVDGAGERTGFLMLAPITAFVTVDDAAATFPLGDGTLAYAGDVDDDGALDLALGEPEASRGDGPRGRVRVLRGPFVGEVDPAVHSQTWWGKGETDHCGSRISWIGDADGAPGDELGVYCHNPGPPEQWFIEIVSAG